MQPKTESMAFFESHSYTPPSCFGTISIPDQASLLIWVKPILQFILVRKLNLEWLIICTYSSNKLRDVYDYTILYHIYLINPKIIRDLGTRPSSTPKKFIKNIKIRGWRGE